MILFPAIDLKDGQCVRLFKGDMAQATVFNPDPADQARRFAAQGVDWLHLVDLNGAFAGRPVNGEAVRRILAAVDVPVQLGGGIRAADTARMWLDAGVSRVILGTAAVKNPDFVKSVCREHPGRIVVGIDAREGRVAIAGWADTTTMLASDLAKAFEDAGAAAIVYTDIERDGTGTGLNVESTIALAEAVRVPVIASGGVSSLEDIVRLKAAAAATSGIIEGVICGRALYDGRLDLAAALQAVKETAGC